MALMVSLQDGSCSKESCLFQLSDDDFISVIDTDVLKLHQKLLLLLVLFLFSFVIIIRFFSCLY